MGLLKAWRGERWKSWPDEIVLVRRDKKGRFMKGSHIRRKYRPEDYI